MKLTINCMFLALTFGILACQDGSMQNDSKANNDSVSTSMMRAKEIGEKLEGKFIQIEKLSERTYALKVQISEDSSMVFETLMPLSTTEIDLLKKNSNNLKLTYTTYTNPVTNKEVKMIRYMEPIYEGSK